MKNFVSKLWAILSIFLLLATFLFGQQIQDVLMRAPFMKIDPYYSGGDIERSFDTTSYSVKIHQKVFPALFGESDEGFRQITIINNDSVVNGFDILPFAVDSLTTVRIENNIPIVVGAGRVDTIREVGLSKEKMIFRINEKK